MERMEELEMEKKSSTQPNPHDLPSPILLSGTGVAGGEGRMLAVMVGEASAIGQIRKTLEVRDEETPLQGKLDKIATDIGLMGTYAAVLTIHILLLRFLFEGLIDRSIDLFGGEADASNLLLANIQIWISYFIIGVAIIVVAVPEGLPLAVMISLAYSIGKMADDHNEVKKLQSCEIMGGANNICSDKTGTLTENKMKVTRMWCGKDVEVSQDRSEDGEMCSLKWEDIVHAEHAKHIEHGISCNTAENAGATDKAMIELLSRCGTDMVALRKAHLPEEAKRIRFPFNSTRKRMSTLLEGITGEGYDKRLHIKGASELIVSCCSHYVNAEGEVTELSDEMKGEISNIIDTYAK